MKSDLESINKSVNKNVTIIGAGAWGSALAGLVQTNQHHVQIWSRQSPITLAEVVRNSDAIISAVSMRGVRSIAEQLQKANLQPHAVLVSATKGLEAITGQTPSQIWRSLLPDHPLVVLSGRISLKKLSMANLRLRWSLVQMIAPRNSFKLFLLPEISGSIQIPIRLVWSWAGH